MEIVNREPTATGGGPVTQNKDIEHQEVVASIYDITDTCFDILERLVLASDANLPLQLGPSIYDETLSHESSRDIRGLRNSFAFWVDYTGALAPIQASLDYRLKGHDQIKEMVIELLEMVERNLSRLEQNYKENPVFSDAESQRRLSAIDSALDRLNYLARAIRKASVRDQDQDLLSFESDEDKLFRKVAISYVKWKHPNASPSLRDHMGDSIAAHRRILLLKHRHANKLKLRRAPKQPYPQKAEQPALTSVKIEHEKMQAPKVILRGQQPTVTDSRMTQASKMDGKAALQFIYQETKKLSTRSAGSFQPGSSAQMEYPDPPRINPGEKHTRCPYCLEPLLEAKLLGGSKDRYWVSHLNQDLHPYICLFPRCTNSEFASQSDWSNHMTASHSREWPRKVHAMRWFCDLDHDAPEEFDNEEDWREHMLTPSLHRSRSKLPTDAQLDALAVRKQQIALRDPYICPFCEVEPPQISKLRDHGNPTDMEIILINHIAEHVKSLLLLALPALDSETASGEQASITFENSSYKRLRNSPSSFRAPRGGSHMENISLTFDDNDGEPETQVTMSSEDDVNFANEAEVDCFFARIPNTKACFSWDFILPEGWAWNRAYGSLKAEESSLIESYKILLSRVLPGKARDLHISNLDSGRQVQVVTVNIPDSQNANISKLIHRNPNTDMVERRDKLYQIIELSLKHCSRRVDKTLLGHTIIPQNKVKDISRVTRWAEKHIKDAVRDIPYTSIITAGVALVLPLLGNPTAVEAANQDGFIQIASRMRYYAALESLLLFEDLKPDIKENLRNQIVNLYKLIIFFQIRNVIRFYCSRTNNALIEGINYNDWDRRIQGINDESATILSNFTRAMTGCRPDLVESHLQALERLAHEAEASSTTFSSDLKEARSFATAAQEWKFRKQFGESSGTLDKLMDYHGLEAAKQHFLDTKSKIAIYKEQDPGKEANILHFENFNTAFLGNSGTGKTTVAQLYANFLHEERLFESAYVQKISGYEISSEGAKGMNSIIENILENKGGGVILVDDAHQLMATHEDRDGRQALDMILTALENNFHKLAAIFVGHEDEIVPFFKQSPRLESRIPYTIKLADFDDGELWNIFADKINSQYRGSIRVEGDLDGLYVRIAIRRLAQGRGSRGFGNARAVEDLLARIRQRQARRLMSEKSKTVNRNPDYLFLTKEDLIGPNPSVTARNCPAWIKLQELIGLEEVKQSIEHFIGIIELNYQSELCEKPPLKFSLNQLFVGAPGTGKTTVAELYGQLLVDLGYLSHGDIVLKSPADFISDSVIKSEYKTKKILESTVGKVLVINDAYILDAGGSRKDQDKFKPGIIDTIISTTHGISSENRCIILTGYEDKVNDLFQNTNPGLMQRFPVKNPFRFNNFTIDQLTNILRLKMLDNGLTWTNDAIDAARDLLTKALMRPNFANTYEVTSVLTTAKIKYETRLSLLPLEDKMSRPALEAIDFDPEFFQRGTAEPVLDKLFEGLVDNRILDQLVSYQRSYYLAKKLHLDPRSFVPTNFIFKGPPGTVNQTIARHIGKIFYDIGFISTEEIVECSATDLIGQYVGHTRPITRKKLLEGLGCVLIINESGRLTSSSFAAEVVEELLDFLTKPSNQAKIVVILTGLTADINKLLAQYPPLSGLFPDEIAFEAISPDDCIKMLVQELRSSAPGINISDLTNTGSEEYYKVRHLFRTLSVQPDWSNARDIKNIAKQLVRGIINTLHPADLYPELTITYSQVIDSMNQMVEQRRSRPWVSGSSRHPNDNVNPVPEAEQRAAAPPQYKSDTFHNVRGAPKIFGTGAQHHGLADSKTLAQLNSSISQRAQDPLIDRDKEQIPPSWEDNSKREEGVSDTEWQVKSFEEKGDEANLEKFRDRLKEAQNKISEEEEIQKTLREMSRCEYGWTKVGDGYRCGGGAHFVSDKELSERML